jgi:hypothetical protein
MMSFGLWRYSMFKLNPNPTFTTIAKLHVAGSETPAEITVTYKYLNPEALAAWQKTSGEKQTADALFEVMTDWQGIEDDAGKAVPFNLENLRALTAQYHAAGNNLSQAYVRELYGARLKN